jgi:hypothetical protein
MSVLRITRFETDPARTGEMIDRRTALLSALQDAFPGLTESRLARIDEKSWIEVTQWDSAEHLQTALERGPASLPEAGALFALAMNATAETAEIVATR